MSVLCVHPCVSERVCVHVHLCNACEGESTSSHLCMCALVSVSRYRSSFYLLPTCSRAGETERNINCAFCTWLSFMNVVVGGSSLELCGE